MKSKSRSKTSKVVKAKKTSALVSLPKDCISESEEEMMSKQLVESVKSINETIMRDGETVFFTRLPEKIFQLSEYIKNNRLFSLSVSQIHKEICLEPSVIEEYVKKARKESKRFNEAKVKSFEDWRENDLKKQVVVAVNSDISYTDETSEAGQLLQGDVSVDKSCIIPINTKLLDLVHYLENEIRDSSSINEMIRMWIALKIPRMENGNNYGVEIQKECIDGIVEAESQGNAILTYICEYYKERGDYVSNYLSNPTIKDYLQCIIDVDETDFFNIKLFTKCLRDNYVSIYDNILKNLEKLQNPRPSAENGSSFF